MNKRDYYEILGLAKTASAAEIKKAYRKLAKLKHPDRNKSTNAEAEFREVQEAYEILSDDNKRKAYDQFGHAGTQGFSGGGFGGGGYGDYSGFSGGMNGFEDLGDIFSQFFGEGFGGFGFGGAGQGRSSTTRGADIEATLRIDFDEAVFGRYKTISYKRKSLCDDCKGTGAKNGTSFKTCAECKGSGQVVRVQRTFLGSIQTRANCPTCGGKGKIITENCSKCHGEGRIETDENFKIRIPPGIPDGVTLRFKDRGNSGKNGGNYGDLFLTIEVEPHPRLERRGDDIYLQATVDPTVVTLGDEIEIDSVKGSIKLKIPPGTQPGKIFRLADKGGPKFKGNGNGDQYVQIEVKIPEKLTRQQRELWQKLQELRNEKPGIFS